MTDSEIIGALTGTIGIVLTIIGMAVKSTRAISKVETEIRADMDAQIDNLKRDMGKFHHSGMERSDVIVREFGETVAAVRQKIHDVETWNRDTFVRKDSFEMVVGRLEKSIEKLGDKIEDKLERLFERAQPKD